MTVSFCLSRVDACENNKFERKQSVMELIILFIIPSIYNFLQMHVHTLPEIFSDSFMTMLNSHNLLMNHSKVSENFLQGSDL
jgi:urate oxidase